MVKKDIGNKIPIYKLKTTEEIMKYYDEWGEENKYDKDIKEWDYTGPKETIAVFKKYVLNKDIKILDAGCETGLVGMELKKFLKPDYIESKDVNGWLYLAEVTK